MVGIIMYVGIGFILTLYGMAEQNAWYKIEEILSDDNKMARFIYFILCLIMFMIIIAIMPIATIYDIVRRLIKLYV